MRFAAVVSVSMALIAAIGCPALGALRYTTDPTIVFPVLTKNAPLAVKMVCTAVGSTVEDIRASFMVTNRGSALVAVNGGPIWTRVSLRIYDISGKLIPVNGDRFWAGNYPIGSIMVPAGQSVEMHDLVDDDPTGTRFPLSHFGYHHLRAGTYKLVADATDPSVANLSDTCTIDFAD